MHISDHTEGFSTIITDSFEDSRAVEESWPARGTDHTPMLSAPEKSGESDTLWWVNQMEYPSEMECSKQVFGKAQMVP